MNDVREIAPITPVIAVSLVLRSSRLQLRHRDKSPQRETAITESLYFTPIGPEFCTVVYGTALVRSGSEGRATPPRAEFRENRRSDASGVTPQEGSRRRDKRSRVIGKTPDLSFNLLGLISFVLG